ncbi:MAG: hypothetical protein ACJAS1_000842 [Oleiphilaceae bacterium]|jgi:hypothetical protein
MSLTQIYGSDWPIGATIEMYGEKYRIRKNHGASGEVEYLDGIAANNRFLWTFEGDKASLISLSEKL